MEWSPSSTGGGLSRCSCSPASEDAPLVRWSAASMLPVSAQAPPCPRVQCSLSFSGASSEDDSS
eukprot:1365439-Heterocapsa_arctica.AAC.1